MGKIKNRLLPWDLDGESIRDGKTRKLIRQGEQIFSGRKTFEILPEIEGGADSDDALVTKAYVDSVFGSLAATHSYTLELTEVEAAAKRAVLPVNITGDVTVTRLKLQGATAFLRADETENGFRVVGRNTIDWNGNTSGYFTGAEAGKRITVYYVGTPPAHRQLKVQEFHSWKHYDETYYQLAGIIPVNGKRLVGLASGYSTPYEMLVLNDYGEWQATNGPRGTPRFALGDYVYAVKDRELWESTNGGFSWTKLHEDKIPTSDFFNSFCGSPVTGTFFHANLSDKIYRSTDKGFTWTACLTAPSDRQKSGYYYKNVIALSNGVLLASLGKGVYRSTDDGLNWSFISSTSNQEVWGGFKEISGGSVLFRELQVVRRMNLSNDYGATWKSLTGSGLDAYYQDQSNICAVGGAGEAIALLQTSDIPPGTVQDKWRYWDVYLSSEKCNRWAKVSSVALPRTTNAIRTAPFGRHAIAPFPYLDKFEMNESNEWVFVDRTVYIYRFTLL